MDRSTNICGKKKWRIFFPGKVIFIDFLRRVGDGEIGVAHRKAVAVTSLIKL